MPAVLLHNDFVLFCGLCRFAGSNKRYPDLWPDSTNAHPDPGPLRLAASGFTLIRKGSRIQDTSGNIDLREMRWLVASGVITNQSNNQGMQTTLNALLMRPNLSTSIHSHPILIVRIQSIIAKSMDSEFVCALGVLFPHRHCHRFCTVCELTFLGA